MTIVIVGGTGRIGSRVVRVTRKGADALQEDRPRGLPRGRGVLDPGRQ